MSMSDTSFFGCIESMIEEASWLNELLAVATETFFEKPRQMAKHHAELFSVLQGYYRIDPGEWR